MKRDFINIYAKFLNRFLHIKTPVKAVFDCSNGPASLVLRKIGAKGLKISIINGKIDGRFPAHGPNPLLPGAMDDIKKAVLKNKADLGVIFDADADRAFFIDDQGKEIYPDEAICLLAKNFRQPIAIDVRVGNLIRKSKIKFFESPVGHFFFKNLMRKKKIEFAGEMSGHYYFAWKFGRTTAYYDSGIRGAIEMINQASALKKSGQKLSEFLGGLPKYFRSGEINIKVDDQKIILKNIENFYKKNTVKISRLDGLSMDFNLPEGVWRFNVRPSNTEPYLRINIEAASKKTLKEKQRQIIGIIKKKITCLSGGDGACQGGSFDFLGKITPQ